MKISRNLKMLTLFCDIVMSVEAIGKWICEVTGRCPAIRLGLQREYASMPNLLLSAQNSCGFEQAPTQPSPSQPWAVLRYSKTYFYSTRVPNKKQGYMLIEGPKSNYFSYIEQEEEQRRKYSIN
jgi:hypothetical protein